MTINAQSGVGKIRLFEDFCGGEYIIAGSAAALEVGPFRLVGDGLTSTDVPGLTIAENSLSGAGGILSDDTDDCSTALVTAKCLDVALMGTLILEARVRFADFATKTVFIGFTDENDDDVSIEDAIFDITAVTTVENTASDFVGFFLDAELTEDEMWHYGYNGGATSAETDTTELESDVDAVADEWQILRVEVDNNGTARWFIDGVLKKTLAGAASTTTDLAAFCGVGSKSASGEQMDIDYLLVEANRDWNA